MNSKLVLPESLEPYREWVEPTHDRLARMTLSDVRAQMPRLQIDKTFGTGYVAFPPRDGNGRHVSDYDKNHALAMPYPYGNNNWPNAVIRVQSIQGAIHESTGEHVQIVGFPSSTFRHAGGQAIFASQEARMNVFSDVELTTISLGRFAPYARRHAQILEKELQVKSADVMGMSMGATIALEDSRQLSKDGVIELKSSTHIDPATLHEGVSEATLALGFVTTIGQFFQAVKDTGIPAYNKAQEAGMIHLPGQVIGSIIGTLQDMRIAENTASKSGMANGNFAAALYNFFQTNRISPVSVAVGYGTRVANEHAALKLPLSMNVGNQLEVQSFPYGHALTNHAGIVAILEAQNYARARQ